MILIELGVILLMMNVVGTKIIEVIVKNKQALPFLYQVAMYIGLILCVVSADVLFANFSDGWLLFPNMIQTILMPFGHALPYSDTLNCRLGLIGVLFGMGVSYAGVWWKSDKREKTVRLFESQTKIPIYMYMKDFTFLFSWLTLTALIIVYGFYQHVFDLEKAEPRLFIPIVILGGSIELCLTGLCYIFSREVVRTFVFIEVIEGKEQYKEVHDKMALLVERKTLAIKGNELSEPLRVCIEQGLFEPIGLETGRNIKPDEEVHLRLTPSARAFYLNQEKILLEGVTLAEELPNDY